MSLPLDAPLRGRGAVREAREGLSLAQIEAQIDSFATQPFRRAPFEVEWHKRFAFPLAALVFALVGFPLAVRSHRGGRCDRARRQPHDPHARTTCSSRRWKAPRFARGFPRGWRSGRRTSLFGAVGLAR